VIAQEERLPLYEPDVHVRDGGEAAQPAPEGLGCYFGFPPGRLRAIEHPKVIPVQHPVVLHRDAPPPERWQERFHTVSLARADARLLEREKSNLHGRG
jgi:hypothetical protein